MIWVSRDVQNWMPRHMEKTCMLPLGFIQNLRSFVLLRIIFGIGTQPVPWCKDPGAVALADQMNWGIDRKSMIHHLQSFVQGNNYISYRQGRVLPRSVRSVWRTSASLKIMY